MYITENLPLEKKLNLLSDSAKYDVACTSSGVERKGKKHATGNTVAPGICHSFAADGRCISLLKILFTNECIFDCKYCINRCSNNIVRTAFTPSEVCRLTMEFYRRNYIEGLFLSSGIVKSPNHTMELLYETLRLLREENNFNGYIHVKAIPGADEILIEKTGWLADRMSVNLELPTADGLKNLAPNKNRKTILRPMKQIQLTMKAKALPVQTSPSVMLPVKHTPSHKVFVPAGQSTQMIIGATPENDFQILSVAESLYKNFELKRVFYSAFVKVNEDSALPVLPQGPPLLREHRLYQSDWLLRFYGFKAGELLSEKKPNFNVFLDPKCDWAVSHLEKFPVEINKADYYTLLRVPGIGPKSASKIVQARTHACLTFQDLKKMGVVLKRAVYFITCGGRTMYPVKFNEDSIVRNLLSEQRQISGKIEPDITYKQLSLFDDMKMQLLS